jgi:oligosaccharide 4-alpha-D-glucosyltransferase
MSMSGVPYVHSDAGGFAGGTGDPELYVRWLQFAVFTPIFRPHGTALYEKDTAAFSFPSEAALLEDTFQEFAKAAIGLRYRMLDYNYSLAYQQTKYGRPLIAPLYFHFSTDTTTYQIQDQFMWGENIMVAPVLVKGAKKRRYYLPTGFWFDPVQLSLRKGGQWYDDDVTLADIPYFIREGGFVAGSVGKVVDGIPVTNTSARRGDTLGVGYVVSEKPTSFELYEDDGISRAVVDRKQFEIIKFSSKGKTTDGVELQIRSEGNGYAGKPKRRLLKFLIASPDRLDYSMILVNGQKLKRVSDFREVGPNSFMSAPFAGFTLVYFHYSGKPTSVKLKR